MNIEDYGDWLSIRENGDRNGTMFPIDMMEAINFIRNKLQRGPVHWVNLHRNHRHPNMPRKLRLGFKFLPDNNQEVIVVCGPKGAVRDSNGKPILFPCDVKHIKKALKKHLTHSQFSSIESFLN